MSFSCLFLYFPLLLLVARPTTSRTLADMPTKMKLNHDVRPHLMHIGRGIGWNVDVHTHAQLLQDEFCQVAAPFKCLSQRKPLKTTMSILTPGSSSNRNAAVVNTSFYKFDSKSRIGWGLFSRLGAPRLLTMQLHPMTEFLLNKTDKLHNVMPSCNPLADNVTAALRHDDRQFYAHLLAEGADYAQPSQAKELWRIVRRTLPQQRQKRSQPKPMTLEVLEDQWVPHISRLEAGNLTDAAALINHNQQRHDQQRAKPMIARADLPTLTELERAIRATKAGKALGFDPFESEVYKSFAVEIADIHYPLIAKMFAWGHEPLQWKGGIMHMLPKKVGSTNAEHYRGIMLMGPYPSAPTPSSGTRSCRPLKQNVHLAKWEGTRECRPCTPHRPYEAIRPSPRPTRSALQSSTSTSVRPSTVWWGKQCLDALMSVIYKMFCNTLNEPRCPQTSYNISAGSQASWSRWVRQSP